MDTEAMEPYGQSLLDFFNRNIPAKVVVNRDDGFTGDLLASVFFRKPSEFSPLEQMAMKLCRGWVLDVGAGAGCHSLELQDRGRRVLAIDVFEIHKGPFDTLLMMMHSIGMVEDLSRLDRFLCHAHKLLKPDGQIVFDSLDVRCTDDPKHLAYHEANRRAGRYFG